MKAKVEAMPDELTERAGRMYGSRDFRQGSSHSSAQIVSTQEPCTLESVASQAAKELGAVLAIGDALTASDLPIIRRRLDEVIQATNAAIQACEQQQVAQDAKRTKPAD